MMGQGAGMNPMTQQQMLQRFDKNGNGQLDPDERQAAMQAMQMQGGRPGAVAENRVEPIRSTEYKGTIRAAGGRWWRCANHDVGYWEWGA